ncbi:MAG: hypothetical protein IJE97_02565 [Thermoguttaceae bacterium]|nr:hypothetical protein [Thermoguttaceae bacterium]MBQ7112134.1 hypothetical protein [Thermoguttaceae bacterium]
MKMERDRTRRIARTLKQKRGGKRGAWGSATTFGAWTLAFAALASAGEGSVEAPSSPDDSATASCVPTAADASPFSARGGNAPFARLIDEMRRAEGWKIFESPGARTVGTVGTVAVELEAELGVGDEIPIAAPRNVAVETSPTAQCSRWARFKPGSWARLQTTSVAYENGKTIRSVTETKVSLTSVDVEKGEYELRYDATIKMGGLDYERKSTTARFDFCDAPVGDGAVVETLAPANLTIARKAIPCQTRRVTRTTPQWKETTTLWFSPVVAPHVLQKETTRESVGENDASGETISRELSVARKTAAHLLLGGELTTYVVDSAAQKGTRFDSTTTVCSTTTPGGIARKTTVETDASGVVLLSSTTVALDYYVAP